MGLTNFQAYARAENFLDKLIQHQVLVLPSTVRHDRTTGDGMRDAEYIKGFLSGMASYYLERPSEQ